MANTTTEPYPRKEPPGDTSELFARPPGGHWGAVRAEHLCELRRFLHKVATIDQWTECWACYPVTLLTDLASEAEELLDV